MPRKKKETGETLFIVFTGSDEEWKSSKMDEGIKQRGYVSRELKTNSNSKMFRLINKSDKIEMIHHYMDGWHMIFAPRKFLNSLYN